MSLTLLASDPALGSAGTVKAHAPALKGRSCVVVDSRIPVRLDVVALLAAHEASGALLTVGVRTRRAGDDGVDVLIAADDGRVIGVQPAPHPYEALSELVDARIYAVSPAALDHVGAAPFELGADLLPVLIGWDAAVHVHELRG